MQVVDRYDLSDRAATGVMMSGGHKAVQQGIRVKLPAGLSIAIVKTRARIAPGCSSGSDWTSA
jgi:hypothetical protein